MRLQACVVTALVVALLAGCGGEADTEPGPPEAPTSTSATAERTLKETCPLIEGALPDQAYPGAPALRQSARELGALYEAGDVESQNALEVLAPALRQYLNVRDRGLTAQPLVEADQGYLTALGSVADRCAAVGSSAFQ